VSTIFDHLKFLRITTLIWCAASRGVMGLRGSKPHPGWRSSHCRAGATTIGCPAASPYFHLIFHLFIHIYTYLRLFPPYIEVPRHLRFWKIAILISQSIALPSGSRLSIRAHYTCHFHEFINPFAGIDTHVGVEIDRKVRGYREGYSYLLGESAKSTIFG
jgi:hypothetical protein